MYKKNRLLLFCLFANSYFEVRQATFALGNRLKNLVFLSLIRIFARDFRNRTHN